MTLNALCICKNSLFPTLVCEGDEACNPSVINKRQTKSISMNFFELNSYTIITEAGKKGGYLSKYHDSYGSFEGTLVVCLDQMCDRPYKKNRAREATHRISDECL